MKKTPLRSVKQEHTQRRWQVQVKLKNFQMPKTDVCIGRITIYSIHKKGRHTAWDQTQVMVMGDGFKDMQTIGQAWLRPLANISV